MARDAQVKRVGEDAPAWLVEASKSADSSLDSLRAYRQLSRVKIIQALTKKTDLKAKYGEGAAVIQPGDALVAKKDEPFLFVPLLQFTEFVKWGDLDDTTGAAVMERSFDFKSEIARRARDRNLRREGYGQADRDGKFPFECRYVEHLVFAGVIYGEHPLAGTAVGISFEKGEFFTGTNFCSAILLRKINGITPPLWTQVWELRTRVHKNKTNKEWFGFDFFTPERPFILEEESAGFKKLHADLKADFDKKALVLDREDAADVEGTVSDAEM